ncbi:MAG TPA: hypothetical protein VK308_14655 [Pyrinomonadaceae bacterium]|nr:hypothetical protein [Pyrinomonadaceae bacterium]
MKVSVSAYYAYRRGATYRKTKRQAEYGRACAQLFFPSPPSLWNATNRGRAGDGTLGGQSGDAPRKADGDRSASFQTAHDRF